MTTTKSARLELELGLRQNPISRPFNIEASEPWTPTQQINWAILQAKRAVRYAQNTDAIVFTPDKFHQIHVISVSARELDDRCLKKGLFITSVRALAEVAKLDPNKFSAVEPLSKTFLSQALHFISPRLYVGVTDQRTADSLITFARQAEFNGTLVDPNLTFKI